MEREQLLKAVTERHAVRSYTDEPISDADKAEIKKLIKQYNQEGNLHLQLIENDPDAFTKGKAHYGKFKGVTHYIALVGPAGDDLSERLGYYGEHLVLRAQLMGLNTCWVGMTFSKTPGRVDIAEGEKLKGVIAIGHGASAGVTHKIKRPEQVMKIKDAVTPLWFIDGVKAALLAPTAVNQQKFTFILQNGKVTAKAGWGFFTNMDLGIAKYHFELGSGRKV